MFSAEALVQSQPYLSGLIISENKTANGINCLLTASPFSEMVLDQQRRRFASTSLRCNADMGPTVVGVAGNVRGVPAGRSGAGAGQSGDAGWCLKTGTSPR